MFLLAPKIREKNVTIHTEVDSTVKPFLFDRGRIEQVIINLISNAIDFLAEKRTISIIVKIIDKEYVNLIVEDSGVGIKQENINKVFEPFFTTKNHGQGTGLGLSISKGIIEKHNGKITVASEANGGTKFSILLPYITE